MILFRQTISDRDSVGVKIAFRDETVITDDENEKFGSVNHTIENSKVQANKMRAIMTINIIRYEMFLKEVKPNYIHEDFLGKFFNKDPNFAS